MLPRGSTGVPHIMCGHMANGFPQAVTGLSWPWIALMATAPIFGALLVAYPIWRSRQAILGNLAGSAVIFATALALILREHAEIDRSVQRCLGLGFTCWPDPGAFTRHAIYAFLGLVEVVALFLISIRVEARIRNRGYSPEWR